METKERCDLACEILEKTDDGDDLDPRDLKLVESAVNGFLTEAGYQAFKELHQNVLKGYTKPWFADIEHMTRDHVGYIYWKGHQVEHYDSPWAYTKEGKEAAEELARRCRILEAEGQELNSNTTIWRWPENK